MACPDLKAHSTSKVQSPSARPKCPSKGLGRHDKVSKHGNGLQKEHVLCRPMPVHGQLRAWLSFPGWNARNLPHTVSSHNFHSQKYKLRVSNPRTIAYVHFKMPFESSNILGAGPISPDWTFENWPYQKEASALLRRRRLWVGAQFVRILRFLSPK